MRKCYVCVYVCVCLLTDASTEGRAQFDQHIHKLGPMSPTQSKHELYRSIQKGGNVPEHGLQLSVASDRKDSMSVTSNI